MAQNPAPDELLSHVAIPEDLYKADIALLDHYQAYSSEVLRLSLAGLGVLGFFLANKLMTSWIVAACFGVSVLAFGIAAAFALGHRFYSSDGVFFHIRSLRRMRLQTPDTEGANADVEEMQHLFKRSWERLQIACLSLAIGAIAVAVGVVATLVIGYVYPSGD